MRNGKRRIRRESNEGDCVDVKEESIDERKARDEGRKVEEKKGEMNNGKRRGNRRLEKLNGF